MCELFIGADPKLWESRTRSLRIDGVATSIRIENHFWVTLEEIGLRDGMSVAQLITKLWHEAMDADHDLGNFTSFLRVCCTRYHALMAHGDISHNLNDPVSSHHSRHILRAEAHRHSMRTIQGGKHA
ncbi:ribbon-helix-helix domain-containing protein [Pacificibacter sp. AS14]|uniref:ribbon-helix-helix domain-containing protein n=1 Tax=Pacificibacter sp. AS14 TaxID=3135785 RepID=UPI00316E425C